MKSITIYHSPDADDAFMFYGLVSGAIKVPGYEFLHELSDIETLNQRTKRGELEVTAVSVHAFAYLYEHYSIMSSGASMGGPEYGPKIVSKPGVTLNAQKPIRLAIPGELTSATLATKLFLKDQNFAATLVPLFFDDIVPAIEKGEIDAGVLIHEGQLTHERLGLVCVADLGAWWWKKTSLPLPLGVNVVRKDLGSEAIHAASKALRGTIEYSLAHRKEALAYALTYGRGISESDADTFVGMYVNEITVDMGEKGRKAISLFLQEGATHGFISKMPEIEFV